MISFSKELTSLPFMFDELALGPDLEWEEAPTCADVILKKMHTFFLSKLSFALSLSVGDLVLALTISYPCSWWIL